MKRFKLLGIALVIVVSLNGCVGLTFMALTYLSPKDDKDNREQNISAEYKNKTL